MTAILQCVLATVSCAESPNLLQQLDSPILLEGDDTTAYRDPAVLYHDKTFYLFCTVVEPEPDGRLYWCTSMSKSRDLKHWTAPRKLTPKNQDLNFASPGNVIRFHGEWILCLQTYPIPGHKRTDGVRYGSGDARIWTMRSRDLEEWGEPELLKVKGPDVVREDMGRMIDPYLVEDIHEPGKWWCFYKQRGVSYSWSRDLVNWTFAGRTDSGENVCVLHDQGEYLLFHSPRNGIGMKRSKDLKEWRDVGKLITLGQDGWAWAERRLTAGAVLDLRDEPSVGKYLMFFHGEGPPRDAQTMENFNTYCPIGIAWSDDLSRWSWPGHRSAANASSKSLRDGSRP